MDVALPAEGRRRVVIENLRPRIEDGRFPVKRIVHDPLTVEVDIFADGHDLLVCLLRYRPDDHSPWQEKPLEPLGNDVWRADLTIDRIGIWQFTAVAWVDHFATWRYELTKRAAAGQELTVEFMIGAQLIDGATKRAEKATPAEAELLRNVTKQLRDEKLNSAARVEIALAWPLEQTMLRFADRSLATEHPVQEITVDRPRARFSSWYELFPRSCGVDATTHGTFRDVIARLPRLAEMGFDILYMPPIHPVGDAFRKGKNNNPSAVPGDVGSPWGIGNKTGGHKAIHSQLETLDDFRAFREAAESLGIELALDIAFQCSPDHPYVREHESWFRKRPDGTIQYAENPPKKYQDIYPFDFETNAWPQLWHELKSIFDYWIAEGVRVFRVDNPHTKAFPFWEWAIPAIKRKHPDVLFLSEAFTRPKVKYRLAKLGFSQSYTYFTWRTEKKELIEYLTEVTTPPVNQFFRPNFWPNTPDILHGFLQNGGRPAFVIRLVLAAMSAANYGIYGPAYELCERVPREPGSEEYLNSEKYELKAWEWDRPDSLRGLIASLNRLRREHPALQRDETLRFHPIDNDQLLAFTKHSSDGSDIVLTVLSLDPFAPRAGRLELDLAKLPRVLPAKQTVTDMLSGQTFEWDGPRAYVALDPERPAQVFVLPV